jgi:hypothetical protein
VTANGKRPTVDDVPDEYLMCRDLRHHWLPHDVKVSRKAGEIHRVLWCANCPTQWVQVFTLDGYRVRSRHIYPEQQDSEATPYVLKGMGRLTVDDLAAIRVQSIARYRAGGSR